MTQPDDLDDTQLVQFVLDHARDLRTVVHELQRGEQWRSNIAAHRKMRQRVSAEKSKERIQDRTRQAATRHRYQWTGPELELANRSELKAREVAEMTGRTLKAVKSMRKRLRDEPKLQALL